MQSQLAVDLDPLNPLVLSLNVVVFRKTNEWQIAMGFLERALAIDPDDYFANNIMEFVAYQSGEYEKAIESLKHYLPIHGIATTEIEKIYIEHGFDAAYEETLHQMEIAVQNGMYSPADLGMRYILRNQPEKAMDFYEKGFEIHDQNMPYISTFATDDYINSNPRYLDILEKMNLPLKE